MRQSITEYCHVGKYMRLSDRKRSDGREWRRQRERDEKKKKEKKKSKEGRERERSVDPDPVTEAGDGTTKSNSPSKIESRQGSVYLMKEKRRQKRIPPSPKIKRVGRVEKRSRWTEVRRKAGRMKISKRLRGEDLSRVLKSRFPALSNLLLPRSLLYRQSTSRRL